jgi:hypothetical protein
MAIDGYTTRKSVSPGEEIGFHLSNAPAAADSRVELRVQRVGPGSQPELSASFSAGAHSIPPDAYRTGCGWPSAHTLRVPASFPSGVYVATLTNADGDHEWIRFVIRPGVPGAASRILVCLPFTTTQAYNDWGGKSLYPWDSPDRARKVSFERPAGTNPKAALAFVRWLEKSEIAVEYCTSVDLHADPGILRPYRLFVSAGHDEYWSKEMRDHVETFVRAGGNAAFFSGDTCGWQVRFEDEGRTLVCFRDVVEDPLAGLANDRVTVGWAGAPVDRPENTLTGVSYRRGAGAWLDEDTWRQAVYRVSFAEHWVFDGTGLSSGEAFGEGAVGYETDAADIVWEDGVARATGRDGTPETFVVLAVAELGAWRAEGKGGHATMGVFRAGGTVFTAASVDWSSALEAASPAVDRITRNVLDKLSERYPERGWERVGDAPKVVAMAAVARWIFAATDDGALLFREPSGQNLTWRRIATGPRVVAMAASLEATVGRPVGLFLATSDGRLFWREPLTEDVLWRPIGAAPGVVTMAAADFHLFAASGDGRLLSRPLAGDDAPWQPVGRADGVVAMTAIGGKLYAATSSGALFWRAPVLRESAWISMGKAADTAALAGTKGRLVAATRAGALLWRDGFP